VCLVCVVLKVAAVVTRLPLDPSPNTERSVISSILSESEAFAPEQAMPGLPSEATRNGNTAFTMASPLRSSGSPVPSAGQAAPARVLMESTASRLAISQQKQTQEQRPVLQLSNTAPATDAMQDMFAVQTPARAKQRARRPTSQVGQTLNQRLPLIPSKSNLILRPSSSFASSQPTVYAAEPSQPGEPSQRTIAPAVVRALKNKLSLSQQRRQAQRKFAAPPMDQTTENHTTVPIAAGRGRFRVGTTTDAYKSDHRPHRLPPAPKAPSPTDKVRVNLDCCVHPHFTHHQLTNRDTCL
jgi:hypothetical protein